MKPTMIVPMMAINPIVVLLGDGSAGYRQQIDRTLARLPACRC
jgi:hypothetical protein